MAIKFQKVNHIYNPGEIDEQKALDNIDLTFEDNQFYTIVGKTGNGKSTLIKHLNGLLTPTNGEITFNNKKISNQTKEKELMQIRKDIGLVFQNPNNQLFAKTVLEDVTFGPFQFNYSKKDAIDSAKEKLNMVGLGEEFYDKSPFDLSGGQMRRAALSGILATEPKVLVLDEPLVGLDPKNRKQIMELLKKLQIKNQMTIIMITHYMDDIADFSDRVIIMNQGKIVQNDNPKNVFQNLSQLKKLNLTVPEVTKFAERLLKKLDLPIKNLPVTEEELKRLIKSIVERKSS